MKKLFFTICILLVSACSQSYNNKKLIDCERTGLINKSARMVLQADKDHDKQMMNLAICFGAEVYDTDNDSLKEILNSEAKEKEFMLKTLTFCHTKLQNITPEEFNIMAKKALRASEYAKQHDSCFK